MEIEKYNIDLEHNTINADESFNFLPPPIPENNDELNYKNKVQDELHVELNLFKKSINKKICCFGFFVIILTFVMILIFQNYNFLKFIK